MKKLAFLTVVMILGSIQNCISQSTSCEVINKNKIFMIGDSWAHFMLLYRGYTRTLEQHGFPDVTETGNGTVIMGAQVDTWNDPSGRNAIRRYLGHADDAEFIAVTIGGNDVMWDYEAPEPYTNLEPQAIAFMTKLDTVLDIIEEVKPNAKIILVGYDYPNMVEPLLDNPENPYWGTFESMNYPTPEQLNLGLQYFESFRANWPRIKNDPNIIFVPAYGLMQYHFGQEKPVPVPPYDPYPAFSVPFPGGDPRYPSPQIAMGLNGFDTYHLGQEGFKVLADLHMSKVMLPQLRGNPDIICEAKVENESGYVNEKGTLKKGTILAGRNDEKDDVKAIISIATEEIPDNAVITSASLFITRSGQIGDIKIFEGINPSNAILDIKSGTFGEPTLESSDFSAVADATDIACMYGNAPQKNHTLRFDIHPEALEKINLQGTTQFRLSIAPEGNKSGQMRFYNSIYPRDSSYFIPHLDVKYTLSTPIKENKTSQIFVYPNPASKYIILRNIGEEFLSGKLDIYDITGKEIFSIDLLNTSKNYTIDISNWEKGMYVAKVTNEKGIRCLDFVKQ
jgi:lysophospholipase L1-like esterase